MQNNCISAILLFFYGRLTVFGNSDIVHEAKATYYRLNYFEYNFCFFVEIIFRTNVWYIASNRRKKYESNWNCQKN